MRLDEVAIQVFITQFEREKELDPNCKTCVEVFYAQLLAGKNFSDIFAPRHKASDKCKSGKHTHCSCDTCF